MMENKKSIYEKASAEVIRFSNSDVITTSGVNGGGTSCGHWSNQNHVSCYYDLGEVY
ncbi:hypothetical protein [Faecalibacterium gallinarum]|uniref:Uncharacterized protein n=1 Tax=Faecalibacterium gallinarum TaxID=2903556 RepID=A0AA37IZ30_9FIRM|nr:hypothetical protein [Faecalibacterium gallinarum]GJN64227.1 hypothetical protein JCM17207_08520 [Faecalibacterium gallinarum]